MERTQLNHKTIPVPATVTHSCHVLVETLPLAALDGFILLYQKLAVNTPDRRLVLVDVFHADQEVPCLLGRQRGWG